MAYILFDNFNPNPYRIAANDSDLGNLNYSTDLYNVVDVSDSDFTSVRQNLKSASYSGGNISYTDITPPAGQPAGFDDAASLEAYFDKVNEEIDIFLASDNSNPMATSIKDYQTYLKGLDTSTLTFPMTSTWEKYCADNSISYYHPLQIP